jgi:hypothetical protein
MKRDAADILKEQGADALRARVDQDSVPSANAPMVQQGQSGSS